MAIPKSLVRGLKLPVIGAPLFIISDPKLVLEQCKAGIIGSFPALNARPQPVFEDWLKRIIDELGRHDEDHPAAPAAAFAVNQIVHKSNERLSRDLDLCVKYKVPLVITSLGARPEVAEAVHSYGGIVLHDVVDQTFAKKAIEKGADGLILVGAGAGGHAGNQSPFALMEETRQWFKGPIALSGAIATGRAILAARTLGADFAYMGTAFIATTEANAVDEYKASIVESSASDILLSNLFTGVHGNYLKSSILKMGLDPNNLPKGDISTMDFAANGKINAKPWRDIWGAGQSVGAITEIRTTAERISRLTEEYYAALAAIATPEE